VAEIVWSELALADLHSIIAFIARDSPINAGRFGRKLRDAPDVLARFPEIGSVVPEFDNESIRELLVGVYRIIYEIRADRIAVLGVIQWNRELRRMPRFRKGDN